jgi:hypothetical protein
MRRFFLGVCCTHGTWRNRHHVGCREIARNTNETSRHRSNVNSNSAHRVCQRSAGTRSDGHLHREGTYHFRRDQSLQWGAHRVQWHVYTSGSILPTTPMATNTFPGSRRKELPEETDHLGARRALLPSSQVHEGVAHFMRRSDTEAAREVVLRRGILSLCPLTANCRYDLRT